MKQTPNYNLPQFSGTDFFNKEILNDAFSKIDNGISELQETINFANGDSIPIIHEVIEARKGKESLPIKIAEMDKKSSDIDLDLAEAKRNIITLSDKAKSIDAEILTLSDKDVSTDTEILKINENIDMINNTKFQEIVNARKGKATLLEKIDSIDTGIDAINTDISQYKTSTDEQLVSINNKLEMPIPTNDSSQVLNTKITDIWRETLKEFPITLSNATNYNLTNYGSLRCICSNYDVTLSGVVNLTTTTATADTGGDLCIGDFKGEFLPEFSVVQSACIFNSGFTDIKPTTITIASTSAVAPKTPVRVAVAHLTSDYKSYLPINVKYSIPYNTISSWYSSNFNSKITVANGIAQNNICSKPILICTDSHFQVCKEMATMNRKQVNAINYINEKLYCDFAVLMGDYIDDSVNNTKNEMFSKIESYRNLLLPNTLIMMGNHDENSIYNKSAQSKVLTSADFWDKTMNGKKGIQNNGSKNCYYFVDDKDSKIRHIMLNTTDLPYNFSGSTYDYLNIFAIRQKQIEWLYEILKVPTDWEVIIYSHNGFKTGMPEQTTEVINGDVVLSMIDHFVNGTKATITGTNSSFPISINVDFTTQGAKKVIAFFFGHMHKDLNYVINGINHIGVDSILPQYGRAETGVQSIAFDILQVNKASKVFYLTRFGYGNDRQFSY